MEQKRSDILGWCRSNIDLGSSTNYKILSGANHGQSWAIKHHKTIMQSCIAIVCAVDHDSALHVALKSLNLKNTIHGQIHEISWNHVPTKIHKLIIFCKTCCRVKPGSGYPWPSQLLHWSLDVVTIHWNNCNDWKRNRKNTIWLFNIAMENHHF